ncbi:tumor necrosis factor ligand superfamily member 15 isoform X1 [Bufo bufo]|uniref:tumor necrosis factor ligand superfamily member 15 isoform X1 n=1 Tax=Bufo bufo TaxID=8384 RepID=UPI001ABEAB2E|nr:tumor necrosis factor ligand superfamily member 15 isoform X1 [Bufo bufo]
METSNAMLQEGRNQVTSSSHSLHAQDKSIRRLKWAVAFCFILLATLVLFTVCLLQGGFALRCGFPDKTDKGQMDRQEGLNLDTEKRPKAHLTGTRQIDASGRLHWESKRGLAFLTGGMIYSNKSIVIPKEGYYFVYSQLSFRPAGSTCADDTSISQSITRFNSNYPEPEIILSGISFCTKGSKIYQPISLGGLLHLKTGDQLKVDIRPVSPIDTSVNHKTFFGAFLV